MPRTRKTGEIQVKVQVYLTAQETVLLDRLIETGLFGYTRSHVLRRLADERLVQIVRGQIKRSNTHGE